MSKPKIFEPYDQAAIDHHQETLTSRPQFPVVCLDIDGVLNPLVAKIPTGFEEHHLTMLERNLPKSQFIRGRGQVDLDVRLLLDKHIGKWITSLTKIADVYWATTWEKAANTYLAPLLGIEPLSVIEHSLWSSRMADDAGRWKRYALHDLFPHRPLVWIDDMAWSYDVTSWRDAKFPTLVIKPAPERGITLQDRRKVELFVEKHQPQLESPHQI